MKTIYYNVGIDVKKISIRLDSMVKNWMEHMKWTIFEFL